MSITVTDPGLLAQLRQARTTIELRDPDGNILGTFTVEGQGKLPPGVTSPFTREEMEERRQKHRSGRPLKDILRDGERAMSEPISVPTKREPRRPLALYVNPEAPQHVQDAVTAYIAEYEELLTHAETHPGEDWVAYRGGQRITIGTDHRALFCQCAAMFPDGEFRIFYIDPTRQYPDDAQLLSPPPTAWIESV